MNPVGAEGNIFSSLFDKVPAKRAGVSEDMAGTILYLVSKAGVSASVYFTLCFIFKVRLIIALSRHMWMVSRYVSMVAEFC